MRPSHFNLELKYVKISAFFLLYLKNKHEDFNWLLCIYSVMKCSNCQKFCWKWGGNISNKNFWLLTIVEVKPSLNHQSVRWQFTCRSRLNSYLLSIIPFMESVGFIGRHLLFIQFNHLNRSATLQTNYYNFRLEIKLSDWV